MSTMLDRFANATDNVNNVTMDDVTFGTQAKISGTFQLQDKVVLLMLTRSAPGNERTVRDKSILTTDADKGRLHVVKRLLDCPEYKAIGTLDGQVTAWVARIALPVPFKAGVYAIPLELLDMVDKALTTFAASRATLVENLANVWDSAKRDARMQLGSQFNEFEYLNANELAEAYRMEWQYVTLAAPDSLKAANSEIFKREQKRLQEQWDGAIGDMQEALKIGLQELVCDMVARLSDENTKFKPSKLLARFDEFLSTFNARNVTNDEQLAALANQARALLNGVDTDTLKTNKDVRASVRAGFQQAAATISALDVGKKGVRRISFTDDE